MIYFDNASTTFPKPEEVYEALDYANRNLGFNSGRGSYKKAREVSEFIDETRQLLAEKVKADKNNVIFTASATQALNNIIFGLNWQEGDNVYVTPFEHNAIIRPLEVVKNIYKININIIPFNKSTWEVEDEIDDMFCLKNPKYIFLSSKSNVTGFCIPYDRIFKSGRKYNSINILDASQSFGTENLINDNLDITVYAGHKSLYAGFGIAGYIIQNDIELKGKIFGGTGSDTLNPNMPKEMPVKYEAGSPNAVSIYGLNISLKWLKKNNVKEKEEQLSEYLYRRLKEINKIIIYLPQDNKKCSAIASINVKGYTSDEVGKILDEEFNICVRTGYHCSPNVHEFIDSGEYAGTVRISLSYFNTIDEIDTLINALKTF